MSPLRVLVLGASGMLGHAVIRRFLRNPRRYDVLAAVRGTPPDGLRAHHVTLFDAAVDGPLDLPECDVAVNAVGLIRQRPGLTREALFAVNARFPHRLAEWCDRRGARLIHVTTDCVYSGRRGGYVEGDPHDPTDDYGASKSAGEPPGALCIRTSIIGPEHERRLGLLEWVRTTAERPIPGFSDHFWNGVTTTALAETFVRILEDDLYVPGIRHVFSERVSKYELVRLIATALGVDAEVVPRQTGSPIDRSLASSYDFCERLGLPPISEQIRRLGLAEHGG